MDATFGESGQTYAAEPEWVRYADCGDVDLFDGQDHVRHQHEWQAARGLFFGLVFSVPFWVVIAIAVFAS